MRTSNFSQNHSMNEIKICYWNVHGLKSGIIEDKLLDPDFLKMLKNSDLVALSELHTERKDLFIPGYKILKQKIRKKEHKGPKIGGGIAVFVKENLFDLAHVVPNTNENSIWIKIKSKYKQASKKGPTPERKKERKKERKEGKKERKKEMKERKEGV